MNLEKSHRVRELTEKVQEVVNWKNDLIQRQRVLLQSYHAVSVVFLPWVCHAALSCKRPPAAVEIVDNQTTCRN